MRDGWRLGFSVLTWRRGFDSLFQNGLDRSAGAGIGHGAVNQSRYGRSDVLDVGALVCDAFWNVPPIEDARDVCVVRKR